MSLSLERRISEALEEDIGQEDLTTEYTVPEGARCAVRLVAKQDGVLSGIEVFQKTFELMDASISEWQSIANGEPFVKGQEVARFLGSTRPVLTAERTALNFIQRLSGVATITSQFVKAVEGLRVRICDTRKTTPMFRTLEKRAVVHGGGFNHRHDLFNGILIKDNHIEAAGGIRAAVERVRGKVHHLMKIEVEVKDLAELDEALSTGAEVILLDNMSLDTIREAVNRVAGTSVVLEASGNVTLERVRAIAETGVHIISVGALTHSAPAVDLSLLITKA